MYLEELRYSKRVDCWYGLPSIFEGEELICFIDEEGRSIPSIKGARFFSFIHEEEVHPLTVARKIKFLWAKFLAHLV